MKKSIKIALFLTCVFLLEGVTNDTQAATVTNNPYVISYTTISVGNGWMVGGFSSGHNCDKPGSPPLYLTSCPNSGFYAVNTTLDGSLWTSYWVLCTQRKNSLLGSCAHFTNYRSSYNCTYTTSVASWGACNSSGVQYPTAYNYATVAGSSCADLAPTSQSCSISGSCGAAQGSYLATATTWRSPACSSGNPSVNVVAATFLSMGETRSWTCNGINGGSTASCSATRASNVVNGVCGSGNTTYPSTTTTWPGGTTFCSSGTVSPASPSFPTAGSTTNWQCLGINSGSTASCSATRNLATPQVQLLASTASVSLNNGSSNISPKSVNLSWSILNSGTACGSGCTCVASGDWGGNKTYPSNQSVNVTVPTGTKTFTLTCTNPQGASGSDFKQVSVFCDNYSWTDTNCNNPCGPGNYIKHDINNSCNITDSTGPACIGNPNCPAGTQFEEVKL